MKLLKRFRSAVRNRPAVVNAVGLILVAAHYVAAHRYHWTGTVGHALKNVPAADTSVFFIGAATVGAMAAGFAGVVVIFALGNNSGRFRLLRRRGGVRLRANWTAVVSIAFMGAALCLVAAFLRLAEARGWSWIFEYAVFLLAHGTLRLLWLLRAVAEIVQAIDGEQTERADQVPADQVIRRSA